MISWMVDELPTNNFVCLIILFISFHSRAIYNLKFYNYMLSRKLGKSGQWRKHITERERERERQKEREREREREQKREQKREQRERERDYWNSCSVFREWNFNLFFADLLNIILILTSFVTSSMLWNYSARCEIYSLALLRGNLVDSILLTVFFFFFHSISLLKNYPNSPNIRAGWIVKQNRKNRLIQGFKIIRAPSCRDTYEKFQKSWRFLLVIYNT